MRRLKFLRLERHLSQHQLAALVDLSLPELSRIESGRVNPTTDELKSLAVVLGSTERLMDAIIDPAMEPTR